MKKTLLIVVVLLGVALALSFGSAPAPNSPIVVVAKGKIVNSSTSIPNTVIVTPARDSVYRISIYATISRTDPNGTALWLYGCSWTDVSGTNQAGCSQFGAGNSQGVFTDDTLNRDGGIVRTIEVKGGTSLNYEMSNIGTPDNSAYSLYYTVEQLQ
jgi:hypothetical protein